MLYFVMIRACKVFVSSLYLSGIEKTNGTRSRLQEKRRLMEPFIAGV